MVGGTKAVTHRGTWVACHQVQPHAPPPFLLPPPGERHPRWRCLCPWPGQELWAGREKDETKTGQERRRKAGIKILVELNSKRSSVSSIYTTSNINNCVTNKHKVWFLYNIETPVKASHWEPADFCLFFFTITWVYI